MKEIGELLQNAREEKGLSLEEISNDIKISPRHLKALEEGHFSLFAGEVYLKGALRKYAESLGLDASRMISTYYELLEREKSTEQQKGKETKKKEAKKRKEKPFYSRKERRSFPSVAVIWLSVLVIIVGGSIWYSAQNDREAEGPYDNNYAYNEEFPENNDRPDDEPEVEEPPEPEPEPEPELVEESREEASGVYRVENVAEKEVQLSFTDRCWIRITQDGERVEEGTFEAGETVRLGDAESTEIELGFAAGANIEVNGLAIPELTRPSRMVITIQKGTS